MSEVESLATKKRLMFITGEDSNFLAYNTLLILDGLGCYTSEKALVDHRKCAFLADFLSTAGLAGILDRSRRLKSKLSKRDAHALASSYSRGVSRQHLVTRVVHALARKGVVAINTPEDQPIVSLWLPDASLLSGFVADPIYEMERTHLALVKQACARLRILTFSTFIDRLFTEQGILTWHS